MTKREYDSLLREEEWEHYKRRGILTADLGAIWDVLVKKLGDKMDAITVEDGRFILLRELEKKALEKLAHRTDCSSTVN